MYVQTDTLDIAFHENGKILHLYTYIIIISQKKKGITHVYIFYLFI